MSDEDHRPAASLHALEARVRKDLAMLAYPGKLWVGEPSARHRAVLPVGVDPHELLDCAIVGGGQFGLTIAHGLRQECVERVRVFDRNPAGFEGPWMTFARMKMLRTPKHPTGHDLGNASLTFRAWYEAQHGEAGWDELFRIARPDWQRYLGWYRQVTGVEVRNDVEITAVEPWPSAADCRMFRLRWQAGPHARDAAPAGDVVPECVVFARTVVFASGAEGSGGHAVPGFISGHLPASLYAHTSQWPFDVERLRGKRVGLLGSGAAAFDTAIAALDAGAAEAVLCFRRPSLPRTNPRRWMEFAGFLAHYPELPDAQRWAYMQKLYAIGQPPPEPTFANAVALPGFSMRPGTPWLSVREEGGEVVVTTPGGELRFDFVFAATGAYVDLGHRPEFAGIVPHIALWGERYRPPPGLQEPRLAVFPYLGRYAEFTEKTPGEAPWLSRLFTITRAATLSMGPSAASNSNIKYTAPRIVAGVTRALFLEDAAAHFERFDTANHDELQAVAVSPLQGTRP